LEEMAAYDAANFHTEPSNRRGASTLPALWKPGRQPWIHINIAAPTV
jgi:hypothetical protein